MSNNQLLDDIFREEEERLFQQGRAEITQETAAWELLSQSEKDRINAEREARFANVPEEEEEEPEDEEDDDSFHDEADDLDTLHSR